MFFNKIKKIPLMMEIKHGKVISKITDPCPVGISLFTMNC